MEGEIKAGDEFSANPQQTTPAFATWYSSEKIGPFKATVESGDTSAEASVKFVGGKAITDFLGTDVTKYKIKRFEVYNTTTGKAIATVYGAAAGAAANVTYDGSKGEFTVKVPAAAMVEGKDNEFKAFLVYDQEGSSFIPEMEFHIDHMNVETTERKLKVRWTKEAEQDMMAYHKIDVEQTFENHVVKVLVFGRANAVAGYIDLYSALGILNFYETRLAHYAAAHHSAGNTYLSRLGVFVKVFLYIC